MRKICVVTGSRAEYGLLRWTIEGIRKSDDLELQLIATGMHMSPEFGLTVRAIERDGLKIDRKVEMLLSSDSCVGVTKSVGVGVISFADVFADLAPDILLILGDRFEIFAAATAAMIARIPIGHIHGGEVTEGAIDDAIRHSISKMSSVHFVAADEYRKRLIQMGESPDRVLNVGGLGVDAVKRLKLLSLEELECALSFKFFSKNLMITFHPVTLEPTSSVSQAKELLAALSGLGDTGLIFTMANADAEGHQINREIQDFCRAHVNARVYKSLGQLHYLSCIKHVDGVIGNSSSGLLEAPSLNTGTINIGNRQQGRLMASSVINCLPERTAIMSSIKRLYSVAYRKKLALVQNPYGEGGAAEKIVNFLAATSPSTLLPKKFYDLSFEIT